MYDYILNAKFSSALAAVLLAMVASTIAGRSRLWWRGIAFSYMPMLAATFFLVAPLSPAHPNLVDVLGGLFFEFTVLCLFYVVLKSLLARVQQMNAEDTARLLRTSLVLQLLLAWPLVTSEGFGIFSEGSRIDYLYDGPLGKYVTYAGMLLMGMQAPLIANRISRTGGPGMLGAVVIFVTFGVSVVAGSKGAIFLWIFSTLALVDYRRARISFAVGASTLAVVSAALIVSSVMVADFLGIAVEDFVDLALSRFFLNNDARALAFDYRNAMTPDAGLLGESFRSLATLFGSPPQNSPLGVHLYGELLGGETNSGANASLSALLVYYSPEGYAALPMMIAACGAIALALFFDAVCRTMRSAAGRVLVLVLALLALQQYSQDFLAFQVVMPLVVISIVALWLYDRRYAPPNRSRLECPAISADPEHRHSSA